LRRSRTLITLIEIVERGLKNRDEKLNYLYLKEKVIFEIPSEFIGEDEKIKKILKNNKRIFQN